MSHRESNADAVRADLPSLSAAEVHAAVQAGTWQLADVRAPRFFIVANLPGSVSLPFSRFGFAAPAAEVLSPSLPVAVLGDNAALARMAGQRLAEGGYSVAGILGEGLSGWRAAGLPVNEVLDLGPHELAERLREGGWTVVDVREPWEWTQGMIEGSLGIPLGDLRRRLPELDPAGRYALVCVSGNRSLQAAWILQSAGMAGIANLRGGLIQWSLAGLPLAR